MMCYPDARCLTARLSRVRVLYVGFYVCPCSRRLFCCVSESAWGGQVSCRGILPNVLRRICRGVFYYTRMMAEALCLLTLWSAMH